MPPMLLAGTGHPTQTHLRHKKGARLGPFVFPNAAIRLKPARTQLRALRRIGHLSCSALTHTAPRAPLGFLPPTQAYWRRLLKP
jgi:hypothetical protein